MFDVCCGLSCVACLVHLVVLLVLVVVDCRLMVALSFKASGLWFVV